VTQTVALVMRVLWDLFDCTQKFHLSHYHTLDSYLYVLQYCIM